MTKKIEEQQGRKLYIVWNEARNEGFVTDDEQDAIACCKRVKRLISSTAGDAFAETYDDDKLSMEVFSGTDEPLRAALAEGFCISQSAGHPEPSERSYRLIFSFGSLAALQKAHQVYLTGDARPGK